MLLSYQWLKEYLSVRATPEEIAEKLTMTIAEVEGVFRQDADLKGVVVGRIEKIEKHPNADALSVARISIGSKTVQVIFGQVVKLKVGDQLPIAVTPTRLPGGALIEKKKLRGVMSEGMCCLNSELGILDKAKQVTFFPGSVRPGTPLVKALDLTDTVLEIDNKSLTHRSDLFSHIGIAREIAAAFGSKVKLPTAAKPRVQGKGALRVSVTVKDRALCPVYRAALLDGVTMGPSPLWMQQRLAACGVRPINVVVDVTNYVMLEWGQPLHAFDGEKLAGKTKKAITVRKATAGEIMTTLDGKKQTLPKDSLVIADADGAIAVAGVMGGARAEVSHKTTTVVLESANFFGTSVRNTSRRIGLRTEAVIRFEKGLSPALTEPALMRAIDLLKKYASARLVAAPVQAGATKLTRRTVRLSLAYMNNLIGASVSAKDATAILKRLECGVTKKGDSLVVTIPAFRTDLATPEDVIEEIARVWGYNRIAPVRRQALLRPATTEPQLIVGTKAAFLLAHLGFDEVYSYSFVSKSLLATSGLDPVKHLTIENALSPELTYLRSSLVPGLLRAASDNSRREGTVRIFEIGHTYFPGCECRDIAGVVVSETSQAFFDVKGVVRELLGRLNIAYSVHDQGDDALPFPRELFTPGATLYIKQGKKTLGVLSLLSPRMNTSFRFAGRHVAFFSLSLDLLAHAAHTDICYRPLPKFPSVTRDIAVIVKKTMRAADVLRSVHQAAGPLLTDLSVFDVYEGKPTSEHERSLALRLVFAADHTLTEAEIDQTLKKVTATLTRQNITVRT